jgi:hypothetical protein
MNITLNTKLVAIVGGIVAAGVVIGGGTVAYNNHKAAEAKKAAEIAAAAAYANRPIIATPACVMNGYGKGDCSFTNTGKTAGAQCGYISVQGPGVVTSEQFCSGSVQPYSTTKVEFDIPAVNDLCDNGMESWTEKCNFDFVPSGGDQNAV